MGQPARIEHFQPSLFCAQWILSNLEHRVEACSKQFPHRTEHHDVICAYHVCTRTYTHRMRFAVRNHPPAEEPQMVLSNRNRIKINSMLPGFVNNTDRKKADLEVNFGKEVAPTFLEERTYSRRGSYRLQVRLQ